MIHRFSRRSTDPAEPTVVVPASLDVLCSRVVVARRGRFASTAPLRSCTMHFWVHFLISSSGSPGLFRMRCTVSLASNTALLKVGQTPSPVRGMTLLKVCLMVRLLAGSVPVNVSLFVGAELLKVFQAPNPARGAFLFGVGFTISPFPSALLV